MLVSPSLMYTYTIVAKFVTENLHPLGRPLF